jgi:hypothetical protein
VVGDSSIHVFCSHFLRGDFADDKRFKFHPPIQRGDLVALEQRSHPGYALIVDGVFAGPLAVTGTECRTFMDAGWRLFGCSSLGALRAAELYSVGMIGLGCIYDLLRLGIVTDDAELAVAYHPSTWQELTISLINLRFRLLEAPSLLPEVKQEIWRTAKSIFYMERTAEEILAGLAKLRAVSEEIVCFVNSLSNNAIKQKYRDADYAMRLLTLMETDEAHAAPCFDLGRLLSRSNGS